MSNSILAYGYSGYNKLISGIVGIQGNFQRNDVTLSGNTPDHSNVHCAIGLSDDPTYGAIYVETGWIKGENADLNDEYKTFCSWGIYGGAVHHEGYYNDAGSDTQTIYRIVLTDTDVGEWTLFRKLPGQTMASWAVMTPEYPYQSGYYVWVNKTGDQGIWEGEVFNSAADMAGTSSDKCNCYDLAIRKSVGGVWTLWLDADIQEDYINDGGDMLGASQGFDINEWGNDYISIREFRIWDKYPIP
jgi:hypothetical protein